MGYSIIGSFVGLIAVAILLLAIKLLANSRWVAGFVRGLSGFAAIAIAALLGLSAQDIVTFPSLVANQTVMTVSFHRTSPKHFSVEIQDTNGKLKPSTIEGDEWQLSVRMFHWAPLFKAVGFRSGYQVESIQSRYLATSGHEGAQEMTATLREQENMVDVWSFVHSHEGIVPGVSAVMTSPGFLPLADGAIFEIQLSGTELVSNPMNDAAKNAASMNMKETAQLEEPVVLEEINLTTGDDAPVASDAKQGTSDPLPQGKKPAP